MDGCCGGRLCGGRAPRAHVHAVVCSAAAASGMAQRGAGASRRQQHGWDNRESRGRVDTGAAAAAAAPLNSPPPRCHASSKPTERCPAMSKWEPSQEGRAVNSARPPQIARGGASGRLPCAPCVRVRQAPLMMMPRPSCDEVNVNSSVDGVPASSRMLAAPIVRAGTARRAAPAARRERGERCPTTLTPTAAHQPLRWRRAWRPSPQT